MYTFVLLLHIFTGIGLPLNLSGCTVVPLSLKRRISSLRMHQDCVVIYTSRDCNGHDDHRMIRAPPANQGSLDTWNHGLDRRAVTISSCLYYCLNSTMRKAFPSGKLDTGPTSEDGGEVVIYDEPHFYGEHVYLLKTMASIIT